MADARLSHTPDLPKARTPRVFCALDGRALAFDDLSAATGLPPVSLLRALAILTDLDMIERSGAAWARRRRA